MTNRPLILVTNDDGILAPGLSALVEIMQSLGEVIVVAPDSPQSGMGHAITIDKPLRIDQVQAFEGVRAFECSGTPVDCVKLAINVVEKDRPFDLCVSGINHGSNASINIIYSGTLSAAMEASLDGISSIGFSLLDFSFEADFGPCKPFVKKICQHRLENPNDGANLLNVNIPVGQIKGIKLCRQGEARWVEEFQQGNDPRGKPYYWLTGRFENNDPGIDSDIYALENGYISVVPSMHDLTHYVVMDDMRTIEGN